MNVEERMRRVAGKRRALLGRLDAIDPGRLAVRPGPDEWSVREIVEHLVLSGEVVLGDPSDPGSLEDRTRSLKDRALYWVVIAVLRFDVPVRTPSRGMVPSGELALDELGDRWKEKHRRLRGFLEGLDPRRAGRAIFRHPVAGPMTPTQAVRMLEVHLDHHRRQIRELLEETEGETPR